MVLEVMQQLEVRTLDQSRTMQRNFSNKQPKRDVSVVVVVVVVLLDM